MMVLHLRSARYTFQATSSYSNRRDTSGTKNHAMRVPSTAKAERIRNAIWPSVVGSSTYEVRVAVKTCVPMAAPALGHAELKPII
jgi:hypothetical protein